VTQPSSLPDHVDHRQLSSHLQDHLTAASAGRARANDMADRYVGTDLGPVLRQFASELDDEHARLTELIEQLGVTQPLPQQAVARAGEIVGRFKPNGRLLGTPPTTPLFELELLRGGVNTKMGLWQTLSAYADDLGLDRDEMDGLAEQAADQSRRLEELHAKVRVEAYEPEPGI